MENQLFDAKRSVKKNRNQANEAIERRKRKALYGMRASSKIFE
jgi:hypothetical protein